MTGQVARFPLPRQTGPADESHTRRLQTMLRLAGLSDSRAVEMLSASDAEFRALSDGLRLAGKSPEKTVPLSRVQDLCAKNRKLKEANQRLRDVVVTLTRGFLILNDKTRSSLEKMGAAMPEDILPLLLTADEAKRTEIFAVIADATAGYKK